MFTDFYTQHKRTIIVSLVSVLLAVVSVIIFYTFFVFHITSTTPDLANASYQTPRLVVNFNKDIKEGSVKIVSKNNLNIRTSTKDSKLTVDILSGMDADKKYTFFIESITSTSGDVIKNHNIVLETSKDGVLSDEDQKIILDRQEANKPAYLRDPIFKYLPHSTLDYSISAGLNTVVGEGEKDITIFITAMLSAADVRIDRAGAISSYNQEAMNYLKTLDGINLDNYNFSYRVNAVSL